MSELLTRLRTATDERHQALHSHELLLDLHSGRLSMPTYREILRSFHTFYFEYEARFVTQAGTFVEEFHPLPLLRQDIALTGGSSFQERQTEQWRSEADFSQYLGYLYVKQGSTLGGQQISRHVEKFLGLRPGQEQFFFHGKGRATGANWKAFQSFLAEQETQVVPSVVVTSATDAFDRLRDSLNQNQ